MYKLLELNPQLRPFAWDIDYRMQLYRDTKARLMPNGGMLRDFANAHNYFGIHPVDGGWVYREWAPNAYQLYLTGDFNGWNWTEQPMLRYGDGCWGLFLPGDDALWEGCRVRTIVDANLTRTAHIPIYSRRMIRESDSRSWCAEVVDDRKPFAWTDEHFVGEATLNIYEAQVDTYREFAEETLPRIKAADYNTLLLKNVMEHSDCGGQTTCFYAASSRFGSFEDLKYLVNKAHEMGIRVLMNVDHSHASGNPAEGINLFDGTEYQFFHAGEKGNHPAWGAKCFDYGKPQVIHFLLSNLKFWMTEYHFDGFCFMGVTSMLYHDHGLGTEFDSAHKYFSCNTHVEAITYLQLANELIRQVNPRAITLAEELSGMPGMCLPIEDGGIGFDLTFPKG